jgi:hypothetical protein
MAFLAGELARQGRASEAEPLARQALDLSIRTLGPQHHHILWARMPLVADVLDLQGRYDEAAETPLPEAVAHHHHARRVRHIVCGTESAADHRRDTEDAEVIVRDLLAGNRVGVTSAGQCGSPAGQRGHGVEQPRLAPPVEEVAGRGPLVARPAARREVLPHHDQSIGGGVRERTNQQRVDHGEHGSVRPDAERDGQRRDDGKAWRPSQRPGRIRCIGRNGGVRLRA